MGDSKESNNVLLEEATDFPDINGGPCASSIDQGRGVKTDDQNGSGDTDRISQTVPEALCNTDVNMEEESENGEPADKSVERKPADVKLNCDEKEMDFEAAGKNIISFCSPKEGQEEFHEIDNSDSNPQQNQMIVGETNNQEHPQTLNDFIHKSQETAPSSSSSSSRPESVSLKPCGLLCWGCGEFGQHGHSQKEDVSCKNGLLDFFSGDVSNNIKAMGCGATHTVVVTNSNAIYVWGNGSSGQLGTGNKECQYMPTKINLHITPPAPATGPTVVQGVACGARHTFIWLENGQVFSFGNNFFAQLGYDVRVKGYKDNQVRPHFIRALSYRVVTQVGCGEKHTMFLFETGQVAAVGANLSGQIGNNSRMEAVVPIVNEDIQNAVQIAAGSNHNLVLDANGSVFVWGMGKPCGKRKGDILVPTQIQFPKCRTIVQISGGSMHSLVLTAGGYVYSWGAGTDGQLGHGKAVTYLDTPMRIPEPALQANVVHIAAAEVYSAAVIGDGTLYMWGKNNHTITCDEHPAMRFFYPSHVDCGEQRISQVELGAWHAIATTGIPDWQVCGEPEDSDVDESDEELEDFPHQRESSWLLADLEQDVETESFTWNNIEMPRPYMLNREKTAMTIEEFYAPTPTLARRTPEPEEENADLGNFTKSAMPTAAIDEESKGEENNEESFAQFGRKMKESGTGSFLIGENQPNEAGEQMICEHFAYAQVGGIAEPAEDMEEEIYEFDSNGRKGATDNFAQNDLDLSKTAGTTGNNNKLPPKPPPLNTGNTNRRKAENSLGSSTSPVSPKLLSSHFPQQPTVAQVSKTYADNYSLPKEQVSLANKTIDFVPVENLSSANTTRFVINQHVPIHLAAKRRSDTAPRKREKLQNRQSDQNPTNLRRPKKLQSLKPDLDSQARSGAQLSPQDLGQALNKPKMIPKAVSFIISDQSFPGGPAPGAVPRRNASMPNVKQPLGGRIPKGASGAISNGRQQQRAGKVQYSSASSWKDKRDLLTLKPKDSSPASQTNLKGGGGRGRGRGEPDIFVLGNGPHPPKRIPGRNSAGAVSSSRPNAARVLKESHSMPSLKIVPGGSVGSSTSTISVTTLDQSEMSSIANTSVWLDSSKSETGGSDDGAAQSQLGWGSALHENRASRLRRQSSSENLSAIRRRLTTLF